MKLATFRPILAPIIGAAICFGVSPRPNAFIQPLAERLAAKAISPADESYAGRIEIYIEKWSPDADRDRLLGALHEGPDHLLPSLEQSRQVIGVLTVPGVQTAGPRVRSPWPRNLLFAREVATANGRQIVVAGNRHLGVGELPRWGVSSDPEFSLVDIRIDKDGKGVGKIASADQVSYNATTKMFEMKNYDTQAVRLIDVTEDKH